MDFKFKDRYDFDDLVEIVRCLRQPDGCPWDKVQTHKTIRQDFIEETYEVIEAIDNEDTELLREELGDVLLQVVFHAQIEREKSVFDINDVANDVCQKLIIRHPHVFGDVNADTTEKVLDNWDKIKMQTKSQSTLSESMDSIARSLPSLMRATKMQKKARKAGFDFENVDDAIEKVYEELSEVKEAIKSSDEKAKAEEIGDLLFSVVNVASDKFLARFTAMEKMANEDGKELSKMTLAELEALWNKIKALS